MQLPCAATGGEDGVCLALTQLSKELLETDTASGLQAGGCDSSDCLFCQYRSNSPFHLNAYAGKLTSLLRKRSLNGVTLSSLNSLIDTSSEQGAALLAAATAAMGSNSSSGKRQRASPSTGATATQSGPWTACGRATSPAVADVANDHTLLVAEGHDCTTAGCNSGSCRHQSKSNIIFIIPESNAADQSSHRHEADANVGRSPRTAAGVAGAGPFSATKTAATSRGVPAVHPSLHRLQFNPSSARVNAAPATAGAYDEDDGDVAHRGALPHRIVCPVDSAAAAERREASNEGASPGPSSLRLHCESQHPGRAAPTAHTQRADSSRRGSEQPTPPPDQPAAQPRQEGSQPPPRLLLGQPLPEGWSFQPGWERRRDPAPAELVQVLSLPDAGQGSRAEPRSHQAVCGGHQQPHHHGSAGIVCALEFSPDGRLLAAGGVDKQIRLYNLSEAFGDLFDNDDGESDGSRGLPSDVEDDDEDEDDEWLRATLRGRRAAAKREEEQDVRGSGLRRGGGRRRHCIGDGDSDEEEEEEDEMGEGPGNSRRGGSMPRACSLLAAVQRMPSKISSMAWSPHMDGMLTVGDYDGVILQLHIASGHQVADVDAHGGRKIWSVSHSTRIPHLVASAADDRRARLWAGRGLSHCIASLQPNPRASVCSVDFSPGADHLLALACSDRTAYLYDLRSLGGGPLAALRHHARPASYCRFLGAEELVTAATDASLALWDLRGAVPVLSATMGTAGAGLATAAPAPAPVAVSPFQVVQSYNPGLVVPRPSRDPSPPVLFADAQEVATASGTEAAGAAAGAADPGHHHHGHSGVAVAAAGPVGGGSSAGSSSSSAAAAAAATEPRRVFRGHRNEKNFVGLSVRAADHLLACGSECSRAFAYHTSWSDPLATLELPGAGGFGAAGAGAGAGAGAAAAASCRQSLRRSTGGGAGGVGGGCGAFVSAVCWQPWDAAAVLGLPPLLASATSMGAVSLSVLAARH